MRTQEEIVAYTRAHFENWFFVMTAHDIMKYLSFESAREFLDDDVSAEDWKENNCPAVLTEETVIAEMADYLDFAFEKARNERGLSAARSLQHYTNWFWLLGDEAVKEIGDLLEYENYGISHLERISDWLSQHAVKL